MIEHLTDEVARRKSRAMVIRRRHFRRARKTGAPQHAKLGGLSEPPMLGTGFAGSKVNLSADSFFGAVVERVPSPRMEFAEPFEWM